MELLKNEIAKPIPDYEEYYATNFGRIWSDKTKTWLKQSLRGDKTTNSMYLSVTLCKEGVRKSFTVHRLIALTFLPNPNNLPQVNHKDENKMNNKVENLEWCDSQYNIAYGERTLKSVATRIANGHTTKVIMCDKETHEPIQIFNSAAEGARYAKGDNSVNGAHVLDVCAGKRKSAYGYFWQYLEK